MKQAQNVCRQLVGIMKRMGLDMSSNSHEDMKFANHIRRAILRGFFTKVALALPTKNQFLTLKDDVKALLFPTTFLNRRPQFVMFNELVLTQYVHRTVLLSDDWLLNRQVQQSWFEGDPVKCLTITSPSIAPSSQRSRDDDSSDEE